MRPLKCGRFLCSNTISFGNFLDIFDTFYVILKKRKKK